MAALTTGAYRPRHARTRLLLRPTMMAVIAVPTVAVGVLASLALWHAFTYHPRCTHWVNPERLGWPHSACQIQTKTAPAWWTQKGSP